MPATTPPQQPGSFARLVWRTAGNALICAAVVVVYLVMRHGSWVALQEALGVGHTPLHDFKGFFYPMGSSLFERREPIPGFYYSPTAALGFALLARLPYEVAATIWALLLIAATVRLGWHCREMLPRSPWLGWILVFFSYPLWHNLKFGQVSVLVVVLMVEFIHHYERRPHLAALALAGAITIKYYAALFLLIPLAYGDIRRLAETTAYTIVGLFVIPTAILGLNDTVAFYTAVSTALHDRFGSEILDPNSQSVVSVLLRWGPHRSQAWWPSIVSLIRWGSGLALLANAWVLIRRGNDKPHLHQAAAMLFAATPWFVDTSWPHYFMFIPWCCAVVFSALERTPTETGRVSMWRLTTLLWIALAAVTASMPWFDRFNHRILFVKQGWVFIANLMLVFGLLIHQVHQLRASHKPNSKTIAKEQLLHWSVVIGLVWVVSAAILGRWWLEPYDDAYFFKRFALNALEHGVYAWNVDEGPVHGNTSQLFQLLITPIVAMAPQHTIIWVRIFLGASLVTSILLLRRQLSLLSQAPLVLLMLSPIALTTVWTGMETAVVFVFEAALIVALAQERSRVTLVVLVALLYLARPDTLPVALTAVFIMRFHHGWSSLFRDGIAIGAVVGILLLGLWAYYGTPFPIAFYLKNGGSPIYDEHFVALSVSSKRDNLCLLALVLFPCISILLHVRDVRIWRWVAPAAVLIAYHGFMTIEVMGMHSRYYALALPFLAYATALAYPDYLERSSKLNAFLLLLVQTVALVVFYRMRWIPYHQGWPIGQTASSFYVAMIVASAWVLFGRRLNETTTTGVLLAMGLGMWTAYPLPRLRWPTDRAFLQRHQKHVTSYRGLSRVEHCLGTNIDVFHSEIGVVGLTFPHTNVTDLGGLMSPAFAAGTTDFNALCTEKQPEIIFLPHRNYRSLNQQIRASSCLKGYTQVTEKTSSPLYIRNDRLEAYRCPMPNPKR